MFVYSFVVLEIKNKGKIVAAVPNFFVFCRFYPNFYFVLAKVSDLL